MGNSKLVGWICGTSIERERDSEQDAVGMDGWMDVEIWGSGIGRAGHSRARVKLNYEPQGRNRQTEQPRLR